MRARTRFPSRVFDRGHDPDARFSLANERTLLAWIRTALALTAGGVALEAVGLPLEPTLRLAASLTLLGMGALVPLGAWSRWVGVESALREGRPLPAPWLGLPVALGALVVSALVLIGLVVGR